MKTSKATAVWNGDLINGRGTIKIESIECEGNINYSSRFEGGMGGNPEEFMAAAFAGCFSMALADLLASQGYNVEELETIGHITLSSEDHSYSLSKAALYCKARVPEIGGELLRKLAEEAKDSCPVSQAMCGMEKILVIERME